MAEFAWEARARTGEVRKGVMEADDKEAVNERLQSQHLNPVKVKKKGGALHARLRIARSRRRTSSSSPACSRR